MIDLSDTITLLSLGAGVQSTTLALLAEAGEIERPAAAIFADTGDEPAKVYEHLERLRGMISFPVHIVRVGKGLGADFLGALSSETGSCGQPPFYVRAPDMTPEEIEHVLCMPEPRPEDFPASDAFFLSADDSEQWGENDAFGQALYSHWALRNKALRKDEGGMLWRKCTTDYKIIPIRRKARLIMEAAGARCIVQQIGISTDEAERERTSDVQYIHNDHPLLRLGWSRAKCEAWLWERFSMRVPKSACRWCPYRSNAGWRAMKKDEPDEFELACQFDEAIREAQGKKVNGAGIIGRLYVHRSFTPLRTANLADLPGQRDFGFEQECHGMCGL
ncbi:hypothetical protein OKA04_12755 [Luteolibacter flavescens]|uniref:Phosphoadenosine phosphosulfate reductase n=1 Tax=Luteolibacter flavescens TaxID=1859460 RepID=A0ABT3FPV1_9BACT|nr:hypothetical protein [Luteolibacter flavescens]MCW1885601.1 hypothetical protein [Luteolibacter flavescens]